MSSEHGAPFGAAYVFWGIRLEEMVRFADPADPEDYLVPMTIRPEAQRQFRDLLCLLAYRHARPALYVCWIGLEDDLAAAIQSLPSSGAIPQAGT